MTVSAYIIPTIITIIVAIGLIEKKNVFNVFSDGAIDGVKTMVKMFPTLIGIFLSIGMLRNSGLLDDLAGRLEFLTSLFGIPNEILPLMFIKPISGSASMAFATDIMNNYGVDSQLGTLAGTIMSSSETTFYVIAIYLSVVNIKKSGKVVIPALIADITTMLVAIVLLR